MKMYFFLVIAPLIFVCGNVFVAILYAVKFIAKHIEQASHSTYKWCDDWYFSSFTHMVNDIIEYYKK